MRWWLALWVVLLLGPAAPAEGRGRQLGWIILQGVGGRLDLEYERDHGVQESPAGEGEVSSSTETQNVFRELVALGGRGFVYHPRFLVFDVDGEIELQQLDETAESGGLSTTTDSSSLLRGYGVNLGFFREHRNGVDLFARRRTGTTDSPFAPQQEVVSELEGIRLNLRKRRIPSFFSLQRSTTTQGGAFPLDESRIEARYQADYRGEESEARLVYTLDENDSSFATEALQTHRIELSSGTRLDPDHAGSANLSAGASRQTGLFLFQEEHLAAGFGWAFTPHLRSQLQTVARRQSARGNRIADVQGTFSLVHQLYESLDTNFEFAADHQTINEDGRDDELSGNLSWAYRKRVPGGSVSLSLGGTRTLNREEGLGGRGLAIDERHLFLVDGVVFLDAPSVLVETVVVTDASGNLPFIEGQDYRIETVGGWTRLELVPTGRLHVGDLVLVDYDFHAQPDVTYLSDGWNVGGSYAFNWGLVVYGGRSHGSAHLQSGAGSSLRFQSSTGTNVGARLTRGISTSAVAYEQQENPSSPYDRVQAQQTITLMPLPSLSLAVAGSWVRTTYPVLEASFAGLTAMTRADWRPRRFARCSFQTTYDEREQIADKLNSLRFQLEGALQYRLVEVSMVDTQEYLDSQIGGRDERNRFYVRLRKRF